MTGGKRFLVIVAVALGIFLGALDTTIVGTAMPTVIASLGGLGLYSWVFASYMLTSTVAAPIFGKLSDLFGRKILFVVAIAIFLAGSALCGGAQTMEQLILFRGLQGIGGGGLFALAFTIIGAVFTPVERPRLQGAMSAMWAIASIVGPTTGGFIVDNLGWRWTFFVNLPIGLIPAALVLYALPEQRQAGQQRRPIDYGGALLLAGGVVALLLAVMEGGQAAPWGSPYILSLFAAALLLLAGFLLVERRSPEPIVPLNLFGNRVFAVSNGGNFLTGLALFGAAGFIPLFVQGVLGESATAAGAAITPLSLGWPAGSIIGGQIVNRIGYRRISVAGTMLMTAGFYLLASMGVQTEPAEVGRNVFIIGLGMGLIAPTLVVAIQNNVRREQLGAATSSAQFFRSIGGTLGVSVMGALMANVMYREMAAAGRAGLLDGVAGALGRQLGDPQLLMQAETRSQLPAPVLQALQNGLALALHDVFLLGLVALAAGVLLALLMPDSTPAADMARERAAAYKD